MTPPRRLPAELRFIIDRCRADGRAASAEGVDWDIVARGLERHGLTRVIPSMLSTPGLVPPGSAQALRRIQHDQARAALSQVGEAMRICARLDAEGIRYLLVKGWALSIQLFGQPDLRNSKDFDLLVEPGSAPRVGLLLDSLGYRRTDECVDNVAKEIGYRNFERGVLLEVHLRLTDNAELYSPDFDALWRTRDTVAVGGRRLPTLGREHLSTYLCVHGAKHSWARLMWLLDIAALTGSPSAIGDALAGARRFGLEPVVLHALSLLHDWFGHEVPPDVLARARSSRTVRFLDWTTRVYHTDPQWYAPAPLRSLRRFFQGSLLGRLVTYGMKPTIAHWRGQLAYDLQSPADRALLRLPPHLSWAYPALRPFGWLIRRLRP